MEIEDVHLRNTSASADFNKSEISQRGRKTVSRQQRNEKCETEIRSSIHTRQMCIPEGGTGVSKVINVMLHTMGGWKTRQGRRSI